MTTKWEYSKLRIICDECGEEEIYHGADFRDALASAKANGWVVREGSDGWVHFCEDCK